MRIRLAVAVFLFLIPLLGGAVENSSTPAPYSDLDEQVQALKQEAIEVHQELLFLQEKSFSPETSLLTVFFAIESKNWPPALGNLQIKILLDGDVVANRIYTQDEQEALYRGGFHRVYLGNLPVGAHELVAEMNDTTSKPRLNKRAAFSFNKVWQRKALKVFLDLHGKSPEFSIQEWK